MMTMTALTRAGVFSAALSLGACATTPQPLGDWESPIGADNPLVGRVFDVQAGRFVAPDQAIASAKSARFVLLGETHDNPDHHALQAEVVRAITAAGRAPALVMEMIRIDQAGALDEYLSTADGDAAGLGPALSWERQGWPDYAMYQPIVQAALDVGATVAAGDTARGSIMTVARGGGLSGMEAEKRAALKLEKPLAPDAQADLIQEIAAGHCDLLPENALAPMADAQRYRDATLAKSMIDAADAEDGAVLIAGSGHVRKDRGAPFYIAQSEPGAAIVAIQFLEVGDSDTPSEADFDGPPPPVDYVWFTPRVDRGDPCERMRAHMQRKTS